MDINNKIVGTKPQKIKRISFINDYMVKKIDENQDIKRLLKYNTLTPLSSKGVDLNGTLIPQPDITDTLTKSIGTSKKCIYKGGFADEMVSQEQNYIFVHVFRGGFGSVTGQLKIAVNILIDDDREDLKYSTDMRSIEIAKRIEEIFDGVKVDTKEYVDICGNVEFRCVDYIYERLSKTNSITRTTMVFDVDITTLRV